MLDMNTVTELANSLQKMREMTKVLGQDCKEHYTAIQTNDSQSHRRSYVRSVFAFIEGIVYRMKDTAHYFGEARTVLSVEELGVLRGVSFVVNGEGEASSTPVYSSFNPNFKFAFKIFSKSFDSSFQLILSGSGWQALRMALKVRDRLMHPKGITDLTVTDAEVEAAKKAFDWFFMSHALCGYYAQKAILTKTQPTTESVAALDQQISDLENELLRRGLIDRLPS